MRTIVWRLLLTLALPIPPQGLHAQQMVRASVEGVIANVFTSPGRQPIPQLRATVTQPGVYGSSSFGPPPKSFVP